MSRIHEKIVGLGERAVEPQSLFHVPGKRVFPWNCKTSARIRDNSLSGAPEIKSKRFPEPSQGVTRSAVDQINRALLRQDTDHPRDDELTSTQVCRQVVEHAHSRDGPHRGGQGTPYPRDRLINRRATLPTRRLRRRGRCKASRKARTLVEAGYRRSIRSSCPRANARSVSMP